MDVSSLLRSTRPTRPTIGNNPYVLNGQQEVLYGNDQFFEDATILFCGKAAGPPSKTHWKADSEAKKCALTCCNRFFSLFERRHHCRRCGDIFCGAHCSHYIRLDQNNRFNLSGFASRVCDRCYDDYMRLRYTHPEPVFKYIRYQEEVEDSPDPDSGYNTLSDSYGTDKSNNSTSSDYDILREDSNNIIKYQQPQPPLGYIAPPSMPRNWAWSTF